MKTLAKFTIEEVLPFTGAYSPNKNYTTNDGKTISVKMKSLRYQLFVKSTTCVCCELEGSFFELQRQDGVKDHLAHFNLYGIKDGNKILFTKDHIHPRSAGGKNGLENLQTMCSVCNALKKHYPLTVEELKSVLLFKQTLSNELTARQIARAVENEIQTILASKEQNQCVFSQSL